MTLTNLVKQLIAYAEESQKRGDLDVIKFVETAQCLLYEAIGPGFEFDAAVAEPPKVQGHFWSVADHLYRYGFRSAAEQFLFGWWDTIGERQLEEQRHLYRAHCAYKLTQLYLREGDRGAALRWALLTQAEDLLSRHGEGGGAGRQWLRTVLGMTKRELAERNCPFRTNRYSL
jgi:hypothetical protein